MGGRGGKERNRGGERKGRVGEGTVGEGGEWDPPPPQEKSWLRACSDI